MSARDSSRPTYRVGVATATAFADKPSQSSPPDRFFFDHAINAVALRAGWQWGVSGTHIAVNRRSTANDLGASIVVFVDYLRHGLAGLIESRGRQDFFRSAAFAGRAVEARNETISFAIFRMVFRSRSELKMENGIRHWPRQTDVASMRPERS